MVSISGAQFNTLNPSLQSQVQNTTQSSFGAIFDGYFNQGIAPQNQQVSIPLMILSTVLSALGLNNLMPADILSTEKVDNTADIDVINQAKQGCASDIAALKKAGIEVSDWDKNNTCTLSYQGKTAAITIDSSGKPEFSGDIEFMMEHLQSSDSKEQASVENQNKFLQKLEKAGNPVVGDAKMTSIKVDGKVTSVNEYKTQNGEIYYLDDNGNQVTPDE